MSGGRHHVHPGPQQGYGPPPPMPPHGYGWPQHHEAAVFVNAPSATPINKVTINLVMGVVIIIFVVGATWAGAVQFTELRHAIERIDAKMDNFRADFTSRIDRLEAATWTKTDQALWCSKAEQANSGWRCDDSRPFRPDMPRIDGWKPRG